MDERQKLTFEVIIALSKLIEHTMRTEHQIPDGFELHFGSDNIRIMADIDLDFKVTDKGIKDFLRENAFKVILHPEDLNE